MGLNSVIARVAARRVHILILEIPGYQLLRMHTEAAITARGWVLADAPADADVLLVCGEATDAFVAIADGVWNQIPSPRHHASVTAVDALAKVLDSIPAMLCDQQRQLADARQRPKSIDSHPDSHYDGGDHHDHHVHDDAGHGLDTMQHHGHEDHATAGNLETNMDMKMPSDTDGMDMGGMDMSGPAGIPLASGDGSDRDGLEMDVTHLTLGPLLPAWPVGLVVHCTLHGDVIGEAALELLSGREAAAPPALPLAGFPVRAAELCDAAGRLLAVAGWEPVAAKLLRVRDELLSSPSREQVSARLHRASGQVARSRTLRWSLAGIPPAGGIDARTRLLGWLREAAALLTGETVQAHDSEWPNTLEDVRVGLIGNELSTARLLIACIEPSRIRELRGASHG